MSRTEFLIVSLLFFAGCGTEGNSSAVNQVTVAKLGEETDHLVFFNYVGTDAEFHYFTTVENKRYKVLRAEWDVPNPFPLDGEMELFMTVKDGKLTVPDPKEMAALSEEEVLYRPYKKNR